MFTKIIQIVRRTAAFALWVISGFGLAQRLFAGLRARHSRRGAADEVVVYCVHRSFFLWALILAGFVGAACTRHWPTTAAAWGWAYVLVLVYTLLTLLFDLSTPRALLWSGICALVWLASLYLEDMRNVTMLSGVGRYLRSLHPRLDPGTASLLSWLLLVPWFGALFHSFGRGRKVFSPNSIEEWFVGEGREITDRSGLKFRTRYRDLFETALGFGAGDLEAVDGNHHVVKRWENVLFLALVWRRLDLILHQRSAVVETSSAASVAPEDNDPGATHRSAA